MDPSALLQYCRSDIVSPSSGSVAIWYDQSGLGNHYTQNGPAALPTYLAPDPTLGYPSLQFDGGIQQVLKAPVNFGAQIFIWGIARQDSWAAPACLLGPLGGAGNIACLVQQPASPSIRQSSPGAANPNSGAAIGQWFRFEAWFSNSVADYLKIRGTTASGQNAGDPTNSLGVLVGQAIAGNSWTGRFAEIMYYSRLPPRATLDALDKYASQRYGGSFIQ